MSDDKILVNKKLLQQVFEKKNQLRKGYDPINLVELYNLVDRLYVSASHGKDPQINIDEDNRTHGVHGNH
jgi:hypothetical protein